MAILAALEALVLGPEPAVLVLKRLDAGFEVLGLLLGADAELFDDLDEPPGTENDDHGGDLFNYAA